MYFFNINVIKLRPYHKLQGKQGTKQDEVWGKKDEKLRLKPWEKVTNEREKTRTFFSFFCLGQNTTLLSIHTYNGYPPTILLTIPIVPFTIHTNDHASHTKRALT